MLLLSAVFAASILASSSLAAPVLAAFATMNSQVSASTAIMLAVGRFAFLPQQRRGVEKSAAVAGPKTTGRQKLWASVTPHVLTHDQQPHHLLHGLQSSQMQSRPLLPCIVDRWRAACWAQCPLRVFACLFQLNTVLQTELRQIEVSSPAQCPAKCLANRSVQSCMIWFWCLAAEPCFDQWRGKFKLCGVAVTNVLEVLP